MEVCRWLLYFVDGKMNNLLLKFLEHDRDTDVDQRSDVWVVLSVGQISVTGLLCTEGFHLWYDARPSFLMKRCLDGHESRFETI